MLWLRLVKGTHAHSKLVTIKAELQPEHIMLMNT